jgi:hypothetical protein
MALPDSINTTYAPGSLVKSADLTEIQEWLVTVLNFVPQPDVAKSINVENFGLNSTLQPTTASAGATAWVPLDLPRDWVVKEIHVRGVNTQDDALATASFAFRVGDALPVAIDPAIIDNFVTASGVKSVTGLSIETDTDTSYGFLLETTAGWTPGTFTVSQIHLVMQPITPP